MSDTNIVNQLRLENQELSRRIALQEETSLEKENAGKALEDSEKRYRRLFESAKDGILILDADTGKVVDVNPFLVRLLGYPYDTLCGKHIWDIGVFNDIAASKEAFQTLQDHEMCWIGQPDPDHIVRPLAYEGFTAGYAENINVRWDDSSEGKGPTGTAIRTGRHCVIQSIRESPLFGPWRESAIGHGYRSMAAFPMKSGAERKSFFSSRMTIRSGGSWNRH